MNHAKDIWAVLDVACSSTHGALPLLLRVVQSTCSFTLGELAREFPEIQPLLESQLRSLRLRIPARPPTSTPVSSISGKHRQFDATQSSLPLIKGGNRK